MNAELQAIAATIAAAELRASNAENVAINTGYNAGDPVMAYERAERVRETATQEAVRLGFTPAALSVAVKVERARLEREQFDRFKARAPLPRPQPSARRGKETT